MNIFDTLHPLALKAVAKARGIEPLDPKMQAVAELRKAAEGTGAHLPDIVSAVEWAMDQPTSAASLPSGSIVADGGYVWIKNHPTGTAAWRGTTGGYYHDTHIDEYLRDGATVLRIGY